MLTHKRYNFLDSTFQYKGQIYEYSTVCGLKYAEINYTVNLANIRAVDLGIYSSVGTMRLGAFSLFYDSRSMKNIRKIFSFVGKKTFNNRLKMYIKQIETDGFFVYDNAKIYLSGAIEKKNKIFNIIEVCKKNGLTLGEHGAWGSTYSYRNPYKIHLDDRKSLFSMNHIWIKCSYNRDVFFHLINHILSNANK